MGLMGVNNPIVFVHGFRYDPRTFGPDHPEYHTYPRWREMLPDREVVPFEWFSNPNLWDAWCHKRWNHYRYAWDLAEQASERLVAIVMASRPVDIICHSLGSRVVMQMLHRIGGVSKVLILNGAEYNTTGAKVALACPKIRFYNVVVPADDVLGTLARFAPGRGWKFLGSHGVSGLMNWHDLRLSSGHLPYAWAEAQGFPWPSGDNPRKISDHWYTFENENNWPLYRAVLSGEWDEWLLSKLL